MIRKVHIYFAVALLSFSTTASAGTLTVIRSGGNPIGGVRFIGSRLFGATKSSIYSMNSDGSDLVTLHVFGNGNDGKNPKSPPVYLNGRLYGMTHDGGTRNRGTIYSLAADGSDYRVERNFAAGPAYPAAGFVTDGNSLFGTTYWGPLTSPGAISAGAVISLDPVGPDFQILHAFAGGTDDGQSPAGELTMVGSKLFGTSENGGTWNGGTVFSVNMDGSDFQLIHSFDNVEGRIVTDQVVIRGDRLFGTTYEGGQFNGGIVFACDVDGGNFQTLHSFNPLVDGGRPGSLLLVEDRLYGTSALGRGNLFSLKVDGSDFLIEHAFAPGELQLPRGLLATDGRFIYGTAVGGPSLAGGVFALAIPEPDSTILAGIGMCALLLYASSASRRRSVLN